MAYRILVEMDLFTDLFRIFDRHDGFQALGDVFGEDWSRDDPSDGFSSCVFQLQHFVGWVECHFGEEMSVVYVAT